MPALSREAGLLLTIARRQRGSVRFIGLVQGDAADELAQLGLASVTDSPDPRPFPRCGKLTLTSLAVRPTP